MQLKWLELEHFRNYDKLHLDFTKSKGVALIGPNAQGKTNLLEGIAFLAFGKSFRSRRSIETLGWERPHGRIKGMVDDTELEVFMQKSPEMKKVKTHGNVVKPKEFLGHLRVVLFTPEHLQLISGGPSLRRQFMDRLLIQLHPSYVDALATYTHLLKQRNALLKNINSRRAKEWELDVWDARIVTEAHALWDKREKLLNFLKEQLAGIYTDISGTDEKLTLHSNTHTNRFEELLTAHRESDIRTGSTSVGPHRDDFTLKLGHKELSHFGSRGECRSAVLALKIAEILTIEAETGQKPLLLLDDVFSELDSTRQKKLGQLLKEYQSVITTTSSDHVKDLKHIAVYKVEGGELTSAES